MLTGAKRLFTETIVIGLMSTRGQSFQPTWLIPSFLIHPEVGAVTLTEDNDMTDTEHRSTVSWGLQGGEMTSWQRHANQIYCAMLCYANYNL